jgi:hypothetical protein
VRVLIRMADMMLKLISRNELLFHPYFLALTFLAQTNVSFRAADLPAAS